MLKAVLFDHDGTLVDSEEVHFQISQEPDSREARNLGALTSARIN